MPALHEPCRRPRRVPEGSHAIVLERLAAWLRASRQLVVLSGAGCSTESGIPDYRASDGTWKRSPPMLLKSFLDDPRARERYWAGSLLGWPRVAAAAPGLAHRALARLEAAGFVAGLITQNVDGLHQRAGSRRVIDLHGRLDTVTCLDCGERRSRSSVQRLLVRLNPDWSGDSCSVAAGGDRAAPDGDVRLDNLCPGAFRVPACPACGGLLKPEVVFFGEAVPRPRVEAACRWLDCADALLVVGSSLMVYSGYRFARAAAERSIPVAAINLGRTRADHLLALKAELACGEALSRLAGALIA